MTQDDNWSLEEEEKLQGLIKKKDFFYKKLLETLQNVFGSSVYFGPNVLQTMADNAAELRKALKPFDKG